MELLGEYIGLEGQRQQLRVPCEAPGVTDPFQSLLSGVAQMRELVTELFGSQVQQEAQDRVAAAPDEALDGGLGSFPGRGTGSCMLQLEFACHN
ncbi:EKC/KEOPS complex subunit GON7 isoform X2 [Cervus elaphus]|uniref:EKC/KEOPS complex subunit GON7 isoform X2 n=1 Tax=Cervus canadensis TaxID=1574408 RepID=UPI001C9E41F9|nr:EKC/KEOPS complex subunit GON7 isoform X2 [Cervus canadensis]XP_043777751.1 EKC/KEOPS complex subunit GON7 isoform X2 [Cervus elaphus]